MEAYTKLLVDVGLDHQSDGRISLASGLAQRFGAHLIGLAACRLRPLATRPHGGFGSRDGGCAAERARIELDFRSSGERFHAMACMNQVDNRTEYHAVIEDPAEALARGAFAADLLVIGQASVAGLLGSDRFVHPGDVLMRTGRPTLLVPPGVDGLAGSHILVAWKNAPAARRAIVDAMPFLRQARQVLVCGVTEGDGEHQQERRSLADVTRELVRHGVAAVPQMVRPKDADVAQAVFEMAGDLRADLIIAGSTGKPNGFSWAFGNVTKALMMRCPTCCLVTTSLASAISCGGAQMR